MRKGLQRGHRTLRQLLRRLGSLWWMLIRPRRKLQQLAKKLTA